MVSDVLHQLVFKPAARHQIAEVAYWEWSLGRARFGKYQRYDPTLTYELSNKRQLHANLESAGLTSRAPVTYTTLKNFEECTIGRKSGQWLVKPSRSAEQRGLFFKLTRESVRDRVKTLVNNGCVIQENSVHIDLIQGRKYSLRVFVLMISGVRGSAARRPRLESCLSRSMLTGSPDTAMYLATGRDPPSPDLPPPTSFSVIRI